MSLMSRFMKSDLFMELLNYNGLLEIYIHDDRAKTSNLISNSNRACSYTANTQSEEALHCDDHRDNLQSKLIVSSTRHVTLRVAIKHASSWLHDSRIPTSKWRADCPLMRCEERIIVSLTFVPQKGAGKLMLSRKGRCSFKVYSSTNLSEASRQYMTIFCVSIPFFIVPSSSFN